MVTGRDDGLGTLLGGVQEGKGRKETVWTLQYGNENYSHLALFEGGSNRGQVATFDYSLGVRRATWSVGCCCLKKGNANTL